MLKRQVPRVSPAMLEVGLVVSNTLCGLGITLSEPKESASSSEMPLRQQHVVTIVARV